jgi:hypothetical protein
MVSVRRGNLEFSDHKHLLTYSAEKRTGATTRVAALEDENYLVSATTAATSSATATTEVFLHQGSGFIHSQHSTLEFGPA